MIYETHLHDESLAYHTQLFAHYTFELCSKNQPIMLNIFPITTVIMQQFIYKFISFNE